MDRIRLALTHFRAGLNVLFRGDYYRWRKLDEEVPPHGSRVDLKQDGSTGADWSGYYFGLVTIIDDMCSPCSWSNGGKGRLVLGADITVWRYSE